METVICDYCKQPIAKVDRAKLKLPLTSDQFFSLFPDRQVPDPFHPDADWEFWVCGYCKLRPFMNKNQLTIDGKLTEIKTPGHTCDKCGNEYQHHSSLARHKRDCNG